MKKNYKIITVLLVLVAIVFAATQLSTVGFGYTVESISAPNIVGSSDLSKLNWLVSVVLGGNDRVVFKITDEEFKSESGLQSNNDFQVDIDSIDETLKYNIQSKFDFVFYDYFISEIRDADVVCSGNVYTKLVLDRSFPYADKAICVSKVFKGNYGELSNPVREFKADITISNGVDASITKTISNIDRSVEFRQNNGLVATASWTGSLVTGNPDPIVPDVAVIGGFSNERWRFISDSKFNNYKNAQQRFESFTAQKIGSSFSGMTDFENFQVELVNLARASSNSFSSNIKSVDNVDSRLTLIQVTPESAYLRFISDVNLNNPKILFKIRADWLGVKTLVGQPKIVSVENVKFGNAERGVIPLKIKNLGDDSLFNVKLTNCNNFMTSYGSNTLSVRSGVTESYGLVVDRGAVNVAIVETCTVVVSDAAMPSNTDSASVRLEFVPTQTCTPNSYSPDFDLNAIFKCNNAGTSSVLFKQCSDDSLVKYTGSGSMDGFQCILIDDPCSVCSSSQKCENGVCVDVVCRWWDVKCWINHWLDSKLKSFVYLAGGLLALLTAAVAFSVVKNKFPKDKATRWIISLVLLVATFIAFIYLWWLALIIFVLFLIFKMVMKKFL